MLTVTTFLKQSLPMLISLRLTNGEKSVSVKEASLNELSGTTMRSTDKSIWSHSAAPETTASFLARFSISPASNGNGWLQRSLKAVHLATL